MPKACRLPAPATPDCHWKWTGPPSCCSSAIFAVKPRSQSHGSNVAVPEQYDRRLAVGAFKCWNSIRLFANLFPGALSCQSLLDSALFARLQVEGVPLHVLNDVFGLNLALKPTKSVFQRLALLQPYLCHAHCLQTIGYHLCRLRSK